MFDRDPQQCLDKLVEDDLAGHCLRGLEHRPDIQLLDGRANGSGGRCRDWCVAEMRMKQFELPHLAISSPAQIAVAGLLQIHTGDLLEPPGGVEAGSKFIGERLIVNKAVVAGRADGLLVEVLCVELPAFEASNLGADQRGAVLEIVQAILCPDFELSVMGSQSRDVLLALVGRGGVADCRAGKRPHRSDIPPLPQQIARSRAVIAPSMLHSPPMYSPLQESAPATCESNRRTRHAPDLGYRPNGARSVSRQTAHRKMSGI